VTGRRHVTSHGSSKRGDSLDLLREQDDVLRALFATWDAVDPTGEPTARAVPDAWDRGTVGKLILEHSAVRRAAKADIARVLRHTGRPDLADLLEGRAVAARTLLDRLDERSRGVQPIGMSADASFVDAVDELRQLWDGELRSEPDYNLEEVAAALGGHRAKLRSARFITKHAPTHPAPQRRWYHRIRILVRLHAGYDRLRGFPWAESGPLSDTKMAERFDRDH
jgi:hypothetical protein